MIITHTILSSVYTDILKLHCDLSWWNLEPWLKMCAHMGAGGGRGRKLCDSLIWPADGDKSGDKGDLWTLNPITLLSCSVNTITAYFFLFLLKQTEQTGREDKWMCSNPDTAYVVFSHLPLPPFPPLLLFHCCLYLEPSVPFREDENHQQHIYTCLRLQ